MPERLIIIPSYARFQHTAVTAAVALITSLNKHYVVLTPPRIFGLTTDTLALNLLFREWEWVFDNLRSSEREKSTVSRAFLQSRVFLVKIKNVKCLQSSKSASSRQRHFCYLFLLAEYSRKIYSALCPYRKSNI